MSAIELWQFLPLGYVFSVLIETPVLVVGLSKRHPLNRKIFAGIWLTACTYPIVTLVLPLVLEDFSRIIFLIAAETFAPLVEWLLFWLAFGGGSGKWRDFLAIVIANLASFVFGEFWSAVACC